jgi:SHS2 domain-containing protein
MERYRMLPHTADAKFEAFGATLEAAYGNAALALASLMWDWAAVEPKVELAVKVEGRDGEQLLVRFLGEILYLAETRRFLLGAVSGLRLERGAGGFSLEAALRGDMASGRYPIHGSVKAVTYNEMVIEERDGWRVQVVVDV